MQEDPEPGQAAVAGRADAADRQPELLGYLGVGGGRVRHQQFEHALPPPGQVRQGLADHHCALRGEQPLVDLRLGYGRAVEDDVVVGQDHSLPRRKIAQAFVPRGGREPGAHPIRVLDLVNILQQP